MDYLNLTELTGYLKLSKSTIYKLTMGNKIPFIKRGGRLLFKKETVDQWLEHFAQPTAQELSNNSANILKRSRNED
jgi:excisionase family DNA binding protein